MAEPLKHLIGPHTARDTADAVARAWGPFDHAAFLRDILPLLDGLELMQRGQCIADALHRHLPDDFEQAAAILRACLPAPQHQGLTGWALLSFNQYVATHGRGHLETALGLLKALTPHFTVNSASAPSLPTSKTKHSRSFANGSMIRTTMSGVSPAKAPARVCPGRCGCRLWSGIRPPFCPSSRP